ncbi:uncharacterized protein LOC103106619 isoform X9 [Monodelphis domestica]|uniref:uncharacterized protein LOC103106619 isoform X9 n=1 Tax=Monodelphis domestica TaxID=13616 RepID=UPI0007B3FD99|nr:uncharacterized protein LOC103106619 isoform X9 [Monodelphis domestica]
MLPSLGGAPSVATTGNLANLVLWTGQPPVPQAPGCHPEIPVLHKEGKPQRLGDKWLPSVLLGPREECVSLDPSQNSLYWESVPKNCKDLSPFDIT